MNKNNKYVNILIKRNIRLLLKEKGIKANNETIQRIDKYIKDTFQELLEKILYQLQIEGRKVVKNKDINQATKRLKEEGYEI